MSKAERLQFGEALAAAFRSAGVLTKFELDTSSYFARCVIEAGPLTVSINGSYRPDDPELPF
jgi:hypothetical protein